MCDVLNYRSAESRRKIFTIGHIFRSAHSQSKSQWARLQFIDWNDNAVTWRIQSLNKQSFLSLFTLDHSKDKFQSTNIGVLCKMLRWFRKWGLSCFAKHRFQNIEGENLKNRFSTSTLFGTNRAIRALYQKNTSL